MDLVTHICSNCKTEYNSGNATLTPPGWQWHGSALICGDCITAASFMAHSSVIAAPQVKAAFTPKPKAMVDMSGLHRQRREPFDCDLWQIECNFHNRHRIARNRYLTVTAANPVEAYAKVSTMIALYANDLASIKITPAPIDARQAQPMMEPVKQRITA